MKYKDFFTKMFSETGEVSFSRFITMIIVAFVLGWDTSYSAHFHAIPPTADLLGQAAFMSVFYAVNRTTGKLTGIAPVEPVAPKTP